MYICALVHKSVRYLRSPEESVRSPQKLELQGAVTYSWLPITMTETFSTADIPLKGAEPRQFMDNCFKQRWQENLISSFFFNQTLELATHMQINIRKINMDQRHKADTVNSYVEDRINLWSCPLSPSAKSFIHV